MMSSRLDSTLSYADMRLSEWARWARDSTGSYPRSTLLGRVIEQGITGASQIQPAPPMPDSVAEVDAVLCRMDAELRLVIQIYYLMYAPPEEKARAAGLMLFCDGRWRPNVRKFYRLLDRGRQSVYDALDP